LLLPTAAPSGIRKWISLFVSVGIAGISGSLDEDEPARAGKAGYAHFSLLFAFGFSGGFTFSRFLRQSHIQQPALFV